MRTTRLAHAFVDHFPDRLDPGVLYVSIPFASVAHLCCCGCGSEVVTPLGREEWHLTFDGESISLHPSIGNWGFTCHSHYWIHRNQVRWVPSRPVKQPRVPGTGSGERGGHEPLAVGTAAPGRLEWPAEPAARHLAGRLLSRLTGRRR
ncbi:DUF6527 family protein [Streptacidiphilus cavernicola]|uniref:DUF6527 family protein n=1 Tax=Streptacidiphilus cavernicola TaxID=3342716 RepID=A0ABV6W5V5_9ACTN